MRRRITAVTALAAASGGLFVAMATPALASDAGLFTSIVNAQDTSKTTGVNTDGIQVSVGQPCNASATRHVLKVLSIAPANAADQAAADAWAGDNLYSPLGAGLPGPLTVASNGSIQQVADQAGQSIVPGKWNLELRCQNNLGTTLYEQWHGSVTFSSATAWSADALTAPKAPTTTSVVATPQPVNAGANLTFTATVSESDPAAPTGTVAFSIDGGTAVTAPVNGSGVASLTVAAPAAGSHTVAAAYGGDTAFASSTGNGTFTTAAAPAAATATTLTASPTSGPANQLVTFTGAVANTTTPASVPVGTCRFLDGTTLLGTTPVDSSGGCLFTSSAFTGAGHSFSATFVPTSTSVFTGSSSAAVPASYDGTLYTPDDQTVVVTVPAGNLTIFTPYTPQNPLNLGEMVLAADGSSFSATAPFDKVTVTDTRAGNPGWSASLARADFVGANPADTIPAKNSGFENVHAAYISGNAVTNISVNSLPANSPTYVPGPQRFASAAAGQGAGSVNILGDFVLKGVPTSTKAGGYTTTVTFTVG